MRNKLAELIHEYNDACHMSVPEGAVCSRCDGIAKQVLFMFVHEFTIEAAKPRKGRHS
jgi:hypothetical protein